jgi:hypothetical protein
MINVIDHFLRRGGGLGLFPYAEAQESTLNRLIEPIKCIDA